MLTYHTLPYWFSRVGWQASPLEKEVQKEIVGNSPDRWDKEQQKELSLTPARVFREPIDNNNKLTTSGAGEDSRRPGSDGLQ